MAPAAAVFVDLDRTLLGGASGPVIQAALADDNTRAAAVTAVLQPTG